MSQNQFYEIVQDQILEAMEKHGSDWIKPWTGGTGGFAANGTTGKDYRGINVLLLGLAEHENGFTSNKWATFKQWKNAGRKISKGSKHTKIFFYTKVTKTEKNDSGKNETFSFPILKCFQVFNECQLEGYEKPAPVNNPGFNSIKNADAFISATGAHIRHGENRAYYNGAMDYINMPEKSNFVGSDTSSAQETYYSTLLHELVHWSGHKDRCNREFGKRFGNDAYAFEELVAESGAAMLSVILGINNEPRPDHAKYLNNWKEVIRGDKKAIFTAFSKAQEAIDHLQAYSQAQAIAAE